MKAEAETSARDGLAARLQLDPQLVEEAVLRAIANAPEERAFRRSRDAIYEIADTATREERFGKLHVRWFLQLGLDRAILDTIGEFPLVAERVGAILVRVARGRRDEGADLLVASDISPAPRSRAGRVGPPPTLAIRLRPESLLDTAGLVGLLRKELLLVSDMIDPAFGYEPDFARGDTGRAPETLLIERYKMFWMAATNERLARRGAIPEEEMARSRSALAGAFGSQSAAIGDWLASIARGTPPSHAAILDLVRRSLLTQPARPAGA